MQGLTKKSMTDYYSLCYFVPSLWLIFKILNHKAHNKDL